MIKQSVIAISMVGMMAIAGTAFAAQGQTDTGGMAMSNTATGQGFAALDANGNGQISWSEAKNDIPRAMFETADSNGNGALNKSEYKAVNMSGNSMKSMSGNTSGTTGEAY